MKRFFLYKIGALLLSYSTMSCAKVFVNGIHETQWSLTSSIFECRFVQDIPNFGQAVFYHEAGEDLLFFLESSHNPMKSGLAALVVQPPIWRPSETRMDLGFIQVDEGKNRVRVDSARAMQMMSSLEDGMSPTITRRSRYNDNESIQVSVSPTNFTNYYQHYLDCLVQLLPVNYRQVYRSLVFFETGQMKLNKEAKHVLKNLIIYVKADPKVNSIRVDGHSDSVGRRYHNRRLSEQRANLVTQYLIDQDLDPNMISTYFHGERYPVVSNETSQGRARNRRVMIRLTREGTDNDLVSAP